MKRLIRLANELTTLERLAAGPTYEGYVKKKKKDGEKPLGKDAWESRVLGKGKKDEGGSHPKHVGETMGVLKNSPLEGKYNAGTGVLTVLYPKDVRDFTEELKKWAGGADYSHDTLGMHAKFASDGMSFKWKDGKWEQQGLGEGHLSLSPDSFSSTMKEGWALDLKDAVKGISGKNKELKKGWADEDQEEFSEEDWELYEEDERLLKQGQKLEKKLKTLLSKYR